MAGENLGELEQQILLAVLRLGGEAYSVPVVEELEERTGVVAVSQGSGRPPLQAGMLNNFNLVDDRTPPGQSEPAVPWPIVSPGYFKTLGIPLVQGCTEQVAVVDQAWVRRFSAARNPIGRRFHSSGCNRLSAAGYSSLGCEVFPTEAGCGSWYPAQLVATRTGRCPAGYGARNWSRVLVPICFEATAESVRRITSTL